MKTPVFIEERKHENSNQTSVGDQKNINQKEDIMQNLKLESKLFIKGKAHTITGLHIGGNSGGLQIGGADHVVIRESLDNKPFIPGSSLRGKMRSLLEQSRGPEDQNSQEGGYSSAGKAGTTGILGDLFGVGADLKKNDDKKTPTRLIVRDAFLDELSVERLKAASNTDMPMTEVKTEVSIHRVSSKANPREIERVPAGVSFDVELIVTLFEGDGDGDSHETFLNLIFEALSLIQADSLGGNGSRGYGKVLFKEFKIFVKTAESYKNNQDETEFKNYKIPLEFSQKLDENPDKKAG